MNLRELPLPNMKSIKMKKAEIETSKTYTYKEDDIEAVSDYILNLNTSFTLLFLCLLV